MSVFVAIVPFSVRKVCRPKTCKASSKFIVADFHNPQSETVVSRLYVSVHCAVAKILIPQSDAVLYVIPERTGKQQRKTPRTRHTRRPPPTWHALDQRERGARRRCCASSASHSALPRAETRTRGDARYRNITHTTAHEGSLHRSTAVRGSSFGSRTIFGL